MRSHPYTPPPPLPLLLDGLYRNLPNQGRRASDDLELILSDMDPDTSRLLPSQPRQHRVRVQGRLAAVRSVSVANLNSSYTQTRTRDDARLDAGVGRSSRRRRSSDASSGTEEEVEVRDAQLRGYGIGGAGNIRRPTDIMGGSSRGSSSFTSLFSSSSAVPTSPLDASAEKKKWNLAAFLGRMGDRKGKGKGAS